MSFICKEDNGFFVTQSKVLQIRQQTKKPVVRIFNEL